GVGDPAGTHPLFLRERGDDVLVTQALLLVGEADAVENGAGVGGAGAVGQYQRVLPVLVNEEVEDAFVFQQARDEVVVGLAVLHAVLARLVAAGELEPVVGQAVFREQLLHDVGHGLLLEDAAVGGAREEPRPRDDVGRVARVPAHRPRLHEAADDAVQVTVAGGGGDGDGDVLADDGVEVGVLVAADQLGPEVEEGGDPFGSGERRDEQRVGAEGRCDPEAAVRLREGGCPVALHVPADRGACAGGVAVGGGRRVAHRGLAGAGRLLISDSPCRGSGWLRDLGGGGGGGGGAASL